MSSPYASRIRLAQETTRLRREHGYTISQLADDLGLARQRVSAIENFAGASRATAEKICNRFHLGERRREKFLAAAAASRMVGWWVAREREMGPGQALAANLETGATRISEYQIALVPGLLQTREYSESRVQADPSAARDGFDPAHALAARAERQRRLLVDTRVTYDVVIDELALRRATAPRAIMARQVDHLLATCTTGGSFHLRVLPIDATVVGQTVPRTAFSIYEYPDPEDPVIVTEDSMIEVRVGHSPDFAALYRGIFGRIRSAALTPERSRELLERLAGSLAERNGNR